ncbi:MAG: hypothetical protein RBG13Loki_0530 [Promethearchaeota archaeon CR_4]|nr:MAG: hypothetical protein RBG13Loki_0530 [Candidatus Lokiarchaeota archaeon CR_4]
MGELLRDYILTSIFSSKLKWIFCNPWCFLWFISFQANQFSNMVVLTQKCIPHTGDQKRLVRDPSRTSLLGYNLD